MDKRNLKWAAAFALLIIICFAVILVRAHFTKSASTARVFSDGTLVRTVDLNADEPYEFTVTFGDGGYNVIRVEDGKIGVTDADCPDKICMRRGLVGSGAVPIVCLPHKLYIVIDSSDTDAPDAVTGGLLQ